MLLCGLLLLILQHLMLLFTPNPDEIHKEERADVAGLSNRMRVYFILIFIVVVSGAIFKYMHLPGAGVFLVLGYVFLAIFFFSNRKLTNGPVWMGRVISFSLGMMSLAFLAKVQHWPMNNVLAWIHAQLFFPVPSPFTGQYEN